MPHRARCEDTVHDASLPAVDRVVGPEENAIRIARIEAFGSGTLCRRVDLGVPQDLHDVVVAKDGPEFVRWPRNEWVVAYFRP